MSLIDLGDAMIETKQLSPGTRVDSIYHFGRLPGAFEDDLDAARLTLTTESQSPVS